MEVNFTVGTVPVAKQSARFGCSKNGKLIKYTDQKVKNYAQYVRLCAMDAVGDRLPFSGPVEARVQFRFPWPKTMSRLDRAKVEALPVPYRAKKPDVDNLQKNIFDAMNGVVYFDDSQIVKVTVEKIYHATPSVAISIRTFDETRDM